MYLFGGDSPWSASDWSRVDDSVRGGSSISHLAPIGDGHSAHFHGHLDTSTLGGAGFASQQADNLAALIANHPDPSPIPLPQDGADGIDLSSQDGLLIRVAPGTGAGTQPKKYVVSLKDEVAGERPDGRRRSVVSFEAEFDVPAPSSSSSARVIAVWLPWARFAPTYRGRPVDDGDSTPELDLGSVKSIAIMMRSFFDRQHGDFDLVLYSIEAKKHDDLVRPWWRSIATFPAVFFSLLLVTIVFLEMP